MIKTGITFCLLFISGITFGQSAAAKYIELYKDAAVRIMNENGIPASIVLGVAIHESGSGTSEIARILNNHFGFKGSNTSKDIKSAYKGYQSVEESYADFAGMLKRRNQYSQLFNKYSPYDYYSWAKGIQRGGYAASGTWASQVLAIIKKYELYQYDSSGENYIEPTVAADNASVTPERSDSPVIYRVKSGDTLSEIAQKNRTTVKAILAKNGLKGSHLSIGQKLKL